MEQDTWNVLDSYFQSDKNFLTKHHLDSYNDFIYTKIPNTIKSLNPFRTLKNDDVTKQLKHEVEIYIGGKDGDEIFFTQPSFENELLLPNEARLKNITYKTDLICNILIKYIIYDDDGKTPKSNHDVQLEKIKIGTIPIMLKSNLCLLYKQPQNVLKEFGECPFDQGGYMIVDGKEKVIVAQERIATNRLFINKSKDKDFTYEGLIRCTTEEAAVFPKTVKIGVFSDKYLQGKRNNAIVFSLPNIDREIPIFVLFRAIGVESDKRILEQIVHDVEDPINKEILDFLYFSMRDGAFVFSQEQALDFLRKYVKYDNVDYVRYVLMNDLFPNMNEIVTDSKGDPDTLVSLTKKSLFLGHVVKHIAKICLGMEPESDRDNYAFKRVDISGFLMANLFRDYYNQFRNECRSAVDRQYNYGPWKKDGDLTNLVNRNNRWQIFNSNIIENGMIKSLKGSWGIDQDPSKAGIVQDLSRISFIGYTSHMRRVNTPIDRSIKLVAPHRLHPTQWGSMCPCESPDGASIGLLKNFAMLCHVTSDCSSKEILKCLKDLKMKFLEYVTTDDFSVNTCKILVNSNWVGITNDPVSLVYKLRLLRRNALINVMTSVSWNIVGKEININTEAGRCCRPLYIVHENRLLITASDIGKLRKKVYNWYDLMKGKTRKSFDISDTLYYNPLELLKGSNEETVWKYLEENQSVIEFIDVEESNTCMIAMEFHNLNDDLKKYTHCEIHPSTIFAVLTANIPFANHNQAPRNYFSGAQGKQAIGIYSTSFNSRMDTMSLVLHYPQKRIVNTRYMDYIGNNSMPNGENTIVAIMTYTGFNQEDSVIINKSAIERGLFNLTYYKTIVESEESDDFGFQKIVFCNPAELSKQGVSVDGFGKRFANYTKLDENGFPKENEKFSEGDVYLGKCVLSTQYVEDESSLSIFKSKKKTETFTDKSAIADKTMAGIIDKVYVFEKDNTRTCKIRYRKIRTPVLGDKVGSVHAQKGVIGMIVPHENMPYTKDGIVPDIIINPHAIPTRMTIAHLMECIFSKVGCLQGRYFDSTPFCNQNTEEIYDELQNMGYDRYANEIMYNGITGDQIQTDIFIGPTFYIRMKHMVADKINYRHGEEGGYTGLTRQPVKSRAKGGGLRIGEMETNTILSHGMSAFLKESMMERADKYQYYIDNHSGDTAIANNSKGFAKSSNNDSNTFSRVQVPFSAKLLFQELQTMSIIPRIITTENDEFDDTIQECYDDDAFVYGNEDDEDDNKISLNDN